MPGTPRPEHDDLPQGGQPRTAREGQTTGPQPSPWRPYDSISWHVPQGAFHLSQGKSMFTRRGTQNPPAHQNRKATSQGKQKSVISPSFTKRFLGIYYGCPGSPGLPATHPVNYLFGFYSVIVFIFMFSHPEELLTPRYGF